MPSARMEQRHGATMRYCNGCDEFLLPAEPPHVLENCLEALKERIKALEVLVQSKDAE